MTRATPRERARSRASAALLSALVIALLVPTCVLFVNAWGNVQDRRAATEREADGLTYLRPLNGVLLALADAQSAAVDGRPIQTDQLTSAIQQAAAVDERIGDRLATHERWTELRSKIEGLQVNKPTSPKAALDSYTALGNLIVGLYAKVRDRSGLVHDPDDDAFHLQEAVAAELPHAVIAAGTVADLVVVVQSLTTAVDTGQLPPGTTAAQVRQLIGLLSVQTQTARAVLADSARDLVDGLRAAVDATQIRTLGGNLLSRLDRFQRTADRIASTASIAPGTPLADRSIVPIARAEMRAAASDLATTILSEVDGLLQKRLDAIDRDRLIITGSAGAAILLAVCALIVLIVSSRRRRPDPLVEPTISTPAAPYRAARALPTEDQRWGPDVAVSPYQEGPEAISRWERSGAAQ
ncbi:MAG TPA: hypothetical protein VI011_13260 [Asanoa sp.]